MAYVEDFHLIATQSVEELVRIASYEQDPYGWDICLMAGEAVP